MDRKLLTLLLISISFFANAIDVKSYYSSLDGKSGDDLIKAIMTLTANHTQLSYSNVWAYKSGADYTSSGAIWDMYSNCNFTSNDHCGSTSASTGECECYNREHTVPKSWWGSSTDVPMYTDLHHIIPTDAKANYMRNDWPFDEVKSVSWSNSAGSKLGSGKHLSGTVFEVADEYKGDIARIYFYMVCCYNNKNLCAGSKGGKYFTFSGNKLSFTSMAQEIMVHWADSDPVSTKEINRNNRVANSQKNRNPFIDLPDLYQYIWGNKQKQPYHVPTAIEENINQYSIITNGLIITINSTSNEILSIYDMKGRVVYSQPICTENVEVTVPQSGIYLIRVGNETKKVMLHE